MEREGKTLCSFFFYDGCKSDCEDLMAEQGFILFFLFSLTSSFLAFSGLENECIKNNYVLKNEATCLR